MSYPLGIKKTFLIYYFEK